MPYTTKITTNHHSRYFKYRYEVPQSVLDWYDWLSEDDSYDGWVCYKGQWSHLSDYMRATPGGSFDLWCGYRANGFSSGTLIRISDDCETYQIGRYMQVG